MRRNCLDRDQREDEKPAASVPRFDTAKIEMSEHDTMNHDTIHTARNISIGRSPAIGAGTVNICI